MAWRYSNSHQNRVTNIETRSGRRSHIFARRKRSSQELQARCQRLCREAGGFSRVYRCGPGTRNVLGSVERAPAGKREKGVGRHEVSARRFSTSRTTSRTPSSFRRRSRPTASSAEVTRVETARRISWRSLERGDCDLILADYTLPDVRRHVGTEDRPGPVGGSAVHFRVRDAGRRSGHRGAQDRRHGLRPQDAAVEARPFGTAGVAAKPRNERSSAAPKRRCDGARRISPRRSG